MCPPRMGDAHLSNMITVGEHLVLPGPGSDTYVVNIHYYHSYYYDVIIIIIIIFRILQCN